MVSISPMAPRPIGMRAPEESLTERLNQAPPTEEEDASPAAAVSRFVQSSDEMAASLRSQFRRRNEMGEKLDTLGENFERVLEEDARPRAQQILALAGQGGRSIEWLLQQARQQFPDPSDLVLVLRELLKRREMPQVSRQRLETLLQNVIAQAPAKRLKAGINCALKARLFGKKLALKAGMLRETYRGFLEADEDTLGCYEDWIALYGERFRGDVVEFVEGALLTDIDAQDPSCSRAEFGLLLGRLGEVKRIRSADLLFVQRLCGDALIRHYNPLEADWLVFMLGLVRYPDDLDELLASVLGNSLLLAAYRERSSVLQVLRLACHALPAVLFSDEAAPARVAEQFSRLATLAYEGETLERYSAFHHANLP